MTKFTTRLTHPLAGRRARHGAQAPETSGSAEAARLPARALPIAVLAALGATSLTGPAAAADQHLDRVADELAKRPSTPSMVVLGAPTRSSSVTVEAGDTLSHISARTGVSVAALRRANGIGADNVIRDGQRLIIPAGSSTSGSTSARSSSTRSTGARSGGYSVRSGDTLSQIAQRQGVSLGALQAANPGIQPRALQVGQRLNVPAAGQRSSASTTRTTSSTSSGRKQAVGNTFAGRTYPEATVNAANANHASLASRNAPSRQSMQRTVADTARRHGVDPRLAQAVAFQESGFNQRAVSPANAVGAMQVTPSAGKWASQLAGRELDLLDPQDNATAGVLVLKANLKAAGDERTALAGYYQGLYSVRKNGMYSDTVRYVNATQAHKERYR